MLFIITIFIYFYRFFIPTIDSLLLLLGHPLFSVYGACISVFCCMLCYCASVHLLVCQFQFFSSIPVLQLTNTYLLFHLSTSLLFFASIGISLRLAPRFVSFFYLVVFCLGVFFGVLRSIWCYFFVEKFEIDVWKLIIETRRQEQSWINDEKFLEFAANKTYNILENTLL